MESLAAFRWTREVEGVNKCGERKRWWWEPEAGVGGGSVCRALLGIMLLLLLLLTTPLALAWPHYNDKKSKTPSMHRSLCTTPGLGAGGWVYGVTIDGGRFWRITLLLLSMDSTTDTTGSNWNFADDALKHTQVLRRGEIFFLTKL